MVRLSYCLNQNMLVCWRERERETIWFTLLVSLYYFPIFPAIFIHLSWSNPSSVLMTPYYLPNLVWPSSCCWEFGLQDSRSTSLPSLHLSPCGHSYSPFSLPPSSAQYNGVLISFLYRLLLQQRGVPLPPLLRYYLFTLTTLHLTVPSNISYTLSLFFYNHKERAFLFYFFLATSEVQIVVIKKKSSSSWIHDTNKFTQPEMFKTCISLKYLSMKAVI